MDNYRIAFIHGETEVNKGFKEGDITYYGECKNNLLHAKYLLNFVNEYYNEIPIFRQLNVRHQRELIAFFLLQMGYVVFFNTTSNNEGIYNRYGKTGQLMLPDGLTEVQRESLYQFLKTIPNYEILISYNVTLIDGYLDSKSFPSNKNESPYETIQRLTQENQPYKVYQK